MRRLAVHPKRIIVTLLILVALAFILTSKYSAGIVTAVVPQTRTIELHKGTFPHEAIEITGYKNLQSATFPEGFQVEVKNISQKPIYYIKFVITMEDFHPQGFPSGVPYGFKVAWGNPALAQNSKRAEASDMAIQPSESALVSLYGVKASNYLRRFKERGTSAYKLILTPQVINFGDGTGYQVGSPYPASNQIGSLQLQPGNSILSLSPEICFDCPYNCTRQIETSGNPYSCPGCTMTTFNNCISCSCKRVPELLIDCDEGGCFDYQLNDCLAT